MNRILNLIRSFDKFGYPIGVNYKGEHKYNTLIGVAATILNFCVIVYFSTNKIIDMILRDSQKTFTQKTYMDWLEYPVLNLEEENFHLAYFTFIEDSLGENSFVEIDPRFATLIAFQGSKKNDKIVFD